MGDKCIQILVVKPEGNRPIGRSRFVWEDNIKSNLKELVWKVVDYIHQNMGQGPAVVTTVMNISCFLNGQGPAVVTTVMNISCFLKC
jgi:hypothetical protein